MQAVASDGVSFNLQNNLYWTNYVLWCAGLALAPRSTSSVKLQTNLYWTNGVLWCAGLALAPRSTSTSTE